MKKARLSLRKDYIREIKNSKARFLSIFALVALGVFILVGLTVAGPIIRKSLESFIKDSNTYDICLSIPDSFEDKDYDLLERLEGKSEEEFIRTIELKTQDKALNFHIKSLPKKMSLPQVVKGQLPQSKGQILLDETMQEEGYKIGDRLVFNPEEDKFDPEAENRLGTYSFKVVGFAKSIEFLDESSKGNGKDGGSLDGFAYILPQDFAEEDFQEYYVQFSDLKEDKTWTKDYKEKVDFHRNEIERLFKGRSEERLKISLSNFKEDIAQGKEDIEEGRRELEEGKQDLEEAKEELEEGKIELAKAKELLEKGLITGKENLNSAQEKLAKGKEELLANESILSQGEEALKQGKSDFLKEKEGFEKQEEEFLAGLNTFNVGFLAIQEKSKELLEDKIKIETALADLEKQGELPKLNPAPLPFCQEEIRESHKAVKEYKWQVEELEKSISSYEKEKIESQAKIRQLKEKVTDKALEYRESNPIDYSKLIKEKEVEREALRAQFQKLEKEAIEKEKAPKDPHGIEVEKEEGADGNSNLQEASSLAVKVNSQDNSAEIQTIKNKIQSLEAEIKDLKIKEEGQIKISTEERLALEKYEQAQKEGREIENNLSQAKRKRSTLLASIQKEESKIYKQEKAAEKSKSILQEEKEKQEKISREIAQKKHELLAQKLKIEEAQEALRQEKSTLTPQKEAMGQAQKKIDEAKAKILAAETQLAKKEKDLLQGRIQVEAGKRDLAQGEKELEKGRMELQRSKKEGQEKIAQGQRDLLEGEALYQEGKEEYDRLYPRALRDIAKGQEDINKAEGILSILKKPTYEIRPRSESLMIYTLFDYAVRLDNLAKIFPVFFFAIAMLLCSTTMNRMVEEERINIGTYKALGYKDGQIAGKYVIYGLIAAALGGVIGGLGGNYLIAVLIAKAYATGFAIPKLLVDFYPWQNILAFGIGILSTGLVAYLSVRSSLKQNSATLMRPKAPKHGTRIFLERIGFLWNRLGFFQKVTARNIFRYKKRMFMTLIGVMGCVALLVLGFGIQSSIDGLVDKQFGQLTRFNMIIHHEQALDQEAFQSYKEKLETDSRIENSIDGRIESISIAYNKGLDQEVICIVPNYTKEMRELITLRDRKSQRVIELEQTGIVITEKLADLLNMKIGDTLTFEVDDGRELRLPITNITEGYAGHYMYMTKELYEKSFEESFQNNMNLVKVGSAHEKNMAEMAEEYTQNQSVLSVLDLSGIKHVMDQLTSSIGQIVMVVLVASSLLAIVVLFTLTNINIQERKRELSTIKVLGFYPSEVTTYIYRETGTLTLIGIVIGFFVGKLLHNGVMKMVVPDQSMLDPSLTWKNYAIPGLITLAISAVVCIIVHQALKRINMVEALKAVE